MNSASGRLTIHTLKYITYRVITFNTHLKKYDGILCLKQPIQSHVSQYHTRYTSKYHSSDSQIFVDRWCVVLPTGKTLQYVRKPTAVYNPDPLYLRDHGLFRQRVNVRTTTITHNMGKIHTQPVYP